MFLDSSAFLALVNPHDAYYEVARAVWTKLTDEHNRTFTMNFVVAETHALFLARLGQSSATAFLREMEHTSMAVPRVNPQDEEHARQIIYRFHDKDFSLTDATSFAVMDRLGITHAFTFDRHFAQYGLAILSADKL